MNRILPGGLAVALVTPMHPDGSLDLDRMVRHVEWLIEQGVDALVPCGTTGESATLDPEEQRRVIASCVQTARGRVPVYSGAGTNSTARTMKLARAAREEGVDGLLVVTPYYNKPSQAGLERHYREVAEAGQGLPVILYNVPGRTGVNLKPDTVFRLAELEPILALKDATGDLEQVMTLFMGRPEGFRILSGDDSTALAILALGGDGVISVAGNEAPDRMRAMVHAALEGRLDEARARHYELLPLMRANFVEGNPVPVKTALHLMERMEAHVRGPLAPLSETSLDHLRHVLIQCGLIEATS